MRVTLIVAMAENRVIGVAGGLPWRLSEDLKRFKRLTMGHPMVMGRKTWDSIGRPLAGRESIVVTRQKGFAAQGATVVHSLDEALAHARARGAAEVFVIGGGELYRHALPLADRIELTEVRRSFEGDTTFPDLDPRAWREAAREEGEQPSTHPGGAPLRYAFVTLERT
jgi:dihydrofolate reductase